MACVNSLCRRFKAIFLSSSHNNAEEIEDHEETVQLIFTVNPFAPIAEDDYKIENETTISRQSTQKTGNAKNPLLNLKWSQSRNLQARCHPHRYRQRWNYSRLAQLATSMNSTS